MKTKKIEEVIKNGDKFKITFYPQSINFDVDEHQIQSTTRFGIWNSDCDFILKPKTKQVAPYIRFFDVNADGYRMATTKHRAVSIFLNNQNYVWKAY